MRKGLTTTLMAVAVAVLAVQAMAMAPVIKDIPSPVVGNAETQTPANGFVYPDAIDLSKYVTDQESSSASIRWSFEIVGSSKYKINGVTSMNTSGGDNPVAPGAKEIAHQVAGGEVNPDNNPLTVTIRNSNLSPVVGQDGTTPSGTGIIDAETQAVTFYASDETTMAVSKPVWFYTQVGPDGFKSPAVTCYGPNDFTASTGWTYVGLGGNVSSSFDSANSQLCITTTQSATVDSLAEWKGPYGSQANQCVIPLVANSVYQIRVKLNSSQATVDNAPMFDLTVNNFDQVSGNYVGGNGYGANYFFLSNVGGANAAVTTSGGKQFEFWWCPSPVSVARWNDTSDTQAGPFAPSMAAHRNAFVEFRILQAASNAGTNGNKAFGTVCLTWIQVDRYDMSSMQTVGSPAYNPGTITNSASGGNSTAGTPSNLTATFSGGTLTLKPTNKDNAAVLVNPGNNVVDYTNQAASVDDFPCTMANNELYMVSAGLDAPTQTDADNPPAIFWLGADTLTNELICLSWVAPVNFWHHAMPATGSVQTYKAFFHTNYTTNNGGVAQYSWWKIFRPRFMLMNNTSLGSNEAKTGAVRMSWMRVDKVTF